KRRSTMRTRFRPTQRAVGDKGFPSAPCSSPPVLQARSRRLHPCNAFVPVLTHHQFRFSPPHGSLGAIVEIPEQVDRRIEYSKSYGGKLVAAISRVSLPLSCSEPRRLMQVEWRCTAKESFPAKPQAMRSTEAIANPLVVLLTS